MWFQQQSHGELRQPWKVVYIVRISKLRWFLNYCRRCWQQLRIYCRILSDRWSTFPYRNRLFERQHSRLHRRRATKSRPFRHACPYSHTNDIRKSLGNRMLHQPPRNSRLSSQWCSELRHSLHSQHYEGHRRWDGYSREWTRYDRSTLHTFSKVWSRF